jgi:tRNA nucleotidyltransferase (CCA-adding enzyme)
LEYFLVGGAVRDRLLGYPSSERDWVVVGGTPQQMIDAGFKPVGRDFPVFLHPETGEEYALARTERKSGHGYHGFTFHASPTVTLEEDLARRDLTINAIAQASDGRLIDPFGGRQDLERRLLRHVSPAFAEDPLRILRIARFAARYHHLGFTVAEETAALMRQMVAAGEVDHLVPERVWKETERALGEPNPEIYFQLLLACGALPRLTAGYWRESGDAWRALTRAVAMASPASVRFAVLFTPDQASVARAVSTHWKAPTSYTELCRLSVTECPAVATVDDADSAFALIRRCDALRRPERFTRMLESCAARGVAANRIERLQQAAMRAGQVSTAPLLAQGLQGVALGAALDRARRDAIGELWPERSESGRE